MGRRVLAFFLGMLVGIVFVLGSVVAAVFIVATTLTPEQIYPDSSKFLGDLASMTLYDIYNEISALYKDKLGIQDENGRYYTLGEFMERYHINQVEAFGKELTPDILEIPIFEVFGGTSENATNQIKASVMFSIVNLLTQSTDEDGNTTGGYFGQSAIDKLYKHTMAELLDEEKGPSYVFEEVLLADMLSDIFPAEIPETGDMLMWAFGQSSVGRLLGGFDQNVMLQFKLGGAFETVGQLTMKQLVGSGSKYIELIFGRELFADLIDDEGNLDIDAIMNNLYVGRLLGYTRQEITETEGFKELDTTDKWTVLYHETEEGTTYAISIDEHLYLAKANCGQEEHTHNADDCYDEEGNISCGKEIHKHNVNCYNLVWFDCPSDSNEHEHNEECFLPDYEVSGVMGKLSGEKIKDLSNLSDILKNLTLRDVLGDEVPKHLVSIQDTPIGELDTALDGMYLGGFLEYELSEVNSDYTVSVIVKEGKVVVKSNGKEYAKLYGDKWYQARLNCKDEEHGNNHTEACYDYVWYTNEDTVEGMMCKLANLKVSELSNLSTTIKTFTLKDVLGDSVPDSLKSIENTPIGDIGTAIDNMYLGEFLNYIKKPVNDVDGFELIEGLTDVMKDDNGNIVKKDGGTWYEAVLNCTDTNAEHTHDSGCYDFVWYEDSCNGKDDPEHTHTDECYTAVDGLLGRISRLKMSELQDGERIKEEVNDTPLKDIIDMKNANGLLKELGDVKIGNLSSELDALYVGVAMGFGRDQVVKGEDAEWILIATDSRSGGCEIYKDGNKYYFYDKLRDKYYAATITCALQHEHNEFACFGYVWYNCNMTEEDVLNGTHEHNDYCTVVKGLNAKIANLRIDELSGGNLTSIAQSLTMSDLIDSEMLTLTKDNEDTLDKLFKDVDWREMQLSNFMSTLLDKISSLPID